ncbi:hypothetical protein WJX74_009543 [Apatococcus lobatus]|uniref:Fe2OG dioxygenase domain-containing protein n=1 Tax=Apatococcus lobatus TaxID=904363 RepID=A0AAW1S882_9CHLO
MPGLPEISWAEGSCGIFRRAVAPVNLAQCRFHGQTLAREPNFWISKDDVLADGQAGDGCVLSAVRELLQYAKRQGLPDNWAGVEWWVQMYDRGKGLAFHFDKDETLMAQQQTMHQPVLSSILYLTGSYQADRLGPSVIVDQAFDPDEGEAVPEMPVQSMLIYPETGLYCIFDGKLAHGVLESTSQQDRATLLVNWWTAQPQGIAAAPPRVQELLASSECSHPHEREPSAPLAVAQVKVDADAGPIMVDDLLEAAGVRLLGSEASHAVAFWHPQHQLHPLDLEAAGGQQRCLTAAAFVPSSMMASGSESESADEDSSIPAGDPA